MLNEAIDEVRRAEFFRKGGRMRGVVKGKRYISAARFCPQKWLFSLSYWFYVGGESGIRTRRRHGKSISNSSSGLLLLREQGKRRPMATVADDRFCEIP